MDESADSASIPVQRHAILRTRLTFDENPQPLIELHAPASSPAIDWVRTLLAKGPQPLRREHLHRQPLHAAVPTLHLIVLDTSGSMRQQGRLALATGYAAQLIEQAARAGGGGTPLTQGLAMAARWICRPAQQLRGRSSLWTSIILTERSAVVHYGRGIGRPNTARLMPSCLARHGTRRVSWAPRWCIAQAGRRRTA